MLLGAIADDLTGATDLALTLSREGMQTVQVVGVPVGDFDAGDADAVVVALKSRTIPPKDAVRETLAAARMLLNGGAEQLFFKYCSTFDSTPSGNIGPVAEALLELLDEELAFACPAFPTNGRTVYRGHLFVGPDLLSDSPMKDHPLTPMTDPNLVRVLQAQSRLMVGLIAYESVEKGSSAISAATTNLAAQGVRLAIVDAVNDEHLRSIGQAAASMKLVTGGSGVAMGLPENFRRSGKLRERKSSVFAAPRGRPAIFAGSCSATTRRQIEAAIAAGSPALKVDPFDIEAGRITPSGVADWAVSQSQGIPLIYSGADPAEVRLAQQRLGRENAGFVVERLLADTAKLLEQRGFNRFIVAGGETSGAIVHALGVRAMLIGPEIDPGVPWTLNVGTDRPMALALKSGNFGADDFFLKAWKHLP